MHIINEYPLPPFFVEKRTLLICMNKMCQLSQLRRKHVSIVNLPRTATCIRPKHGFKDQLLLNAGQSVAECSNGSPLQYFWPSLGYHLSLRSFYVFFECPPMTALLYNQEIPPSHHADQHMAQ